MGKILAFEDVEIGQGLKPVKEHITQESIKTYAEASGDFNPLHVDPSWAQKNSPFGGTIAHGLTSLAFISRLMGDHFGRAWFLGGTMEVSFKQPVKPGDVIAAKAKVIGKKIVNDKKVLEISIFVENQKRDTVINGTAKITF